MGFLILPLIIMLGCCVCLDRRPKHCVYPHGPRRMRDSMISQESTMLRYMLNRAVYSATPFSSDPGQTPTQPTAIQGSPKLGS
ncbi:hypothetical protein V8C34DRAFT_294919 [Trichoderma compactum]